MLVLFRGDLRVHDQAALTHAIEDATKVVPLLVYDTRQLGRAVTGCSLAHQLVPHQVHGEKRACVAHSTGCGGLLVGVGVPKKLVVGMARQVGTKRVFEHKDINGDEVAVEQKLRAQ